MYNSKSIIEEVGKIMVSGLSMLIGYWIVILPVVTMYYKYYYTGGDINLVGGVLLSMVEGIIFTLALMFVDILIVRFLFTWKLKYRNYFLIGFVIALMAIILRVYSLT